MAEPTPNSLADPARLAALNRLNLLDSPSEAGFDRLTRVAARVLGAPVCLVSLVDARRQFFKSAHGLGGPAGEARETPLTHSFCQHVVTSGAPLVVAWGKAGFVMCGYLNIEAADKLGVAAAVVRGVKTVDDLLSATVQQVSKAGAARGVNIGMAGRDALSLLL